MPRPAKVTQTVAEGDHWRGFPSVAIKVGGLAPANPLASVRMFFRESVTSATTVLELSTDSASEILITGALSWTFSVLPADTSAIPWGTYVYSVECTDDQGGVYTYFGGTFQVLRDPTR